MDLLSLASSVFHYETEKVIERFEKYKKDGDIIKKKYLSKEITPKEFENWIESKKNKKERETLKFQSSLFLSVFGNKL